MKTLILPVRREYFEQRRDGKKPFEYRLDNAYWRKRLMDGDKPREFDGIVYALGYPEKTDTDRRDELPWRGFEMQTIQHKEFGETPVRVFAIRLDTSPLQKETP